MACVGEKHSQNEGRRSCWSLFVYSQEIPQFHEIHSMHYILPALIFGSVKCSLDNQTFSDI